MLRAELGYALIYTYFPPKLVLTSVNEKEEKKKKKGHFSTLGTKSTAYDAGKKNI